MPHRPSAWFSADARLSTLLLHRQGGRIQHFAPGRAKLRLSWRPLIALALNNGGKDNATVARARYRFPG